MIQKNLFFLGEYFYMITNSANYLIYSISPLLLFLNKRYKYFCGLNFYKKKRVV